MLVSSMPRSIRYDEKKNELVLLDQTKLPLEEVYLSLSEISQIKEAIKNLRVRGAPAIGIAAAWGLSLVLKNYSHLTNNEFEQFFEESYHELAQARPTAVNLTWALNRIKKVFDDKSFLSPFPRALACLQEAKAIEEEDTLACTKIGQYGLELLGDGMNLLTHCNAGHLATSAYGTATAPMYMGHKKGYKFKVYCDETRPLLQGARLTAFELQKAGIEATVICDNMAASLMQKGRVDAILVGCDRVAQNGDTANKIGTLNLAVLASHYKVPFYICAPLSTIDMTTPTGDEINIEERDPLEVTDFWYAHRMAPVSIDIYNPAFDVTDHNLITAFITERGIIYPPFTTQFLKLLKE